MGKRGPPKTPTSILKQRGSWLVNDRNEAQEAQFEGGVPDCPHWLRDEAKEVWAEVVPKLNAVAGLIKKVDRNALARYCQTWAKWRACEEFLIKHGDVFPVKDRWGNVKEFRQFPQVNTSIKLQAQLEAAEKQFGMTASSRAGLTVGRVDESPADATERMIAQALANGN